MGSEINWVELDHVSQSMVVKLSPDQTKIELCP